jgi:Mg-chelatase subunit ChlD
MRAILVSLAGALVIGFVAVAGFLLHPAGAVVGQEGGDIPFRIDLGSVTPYTKDEAGTTVRMVKVIFTITPLKEDAGDVSQYKILIKEDGKIVKTESVPQGKKSEDLSVVLAVDTRGSMAQGNRMSQVRGATKVFFEQLPAKAEAGLLLFNDNKVREKEELRRGDRQPLIDRIAKIQPTGGSAWMNATIEAVKMLAKAKHVGKAVVLLTDGVDLNSGSTSLATVIAEANKGHVKVYTIGIGEPGKQEKVTSVLVLDKSGSMNEPADDQDPVAKFKAVQAAATRFLSFVRETNPPIVQSTVLWFSDEPAVPGRFTNVRAKLASDISNEKAKGETALFDAVFEGLVALEAERPAGKRAIVAMTDGVDNSSRRRKEEVIARAKEAKIPLYMLGFGRSGELDATAMMQMAEQTGGQYFHAKNQTALMDIFEKLSLKLHDDGIDEAALKELARKTGGQYYAAKDAGQLKNVLEQVQVAMQPETREVNFASLVQIDDGRQRAVTLHLVRGDVEVSRQESSYIVHGLVIPEANQFVYLGLLVVLGLLLALPVGLRRLSKSES